MNAGMENGSDLAALVDGFMKEHGLSRKRFAVLLGLSDDRAGYNTITRWLLRQSVPAPYLRLALAELERRLAGKDEKHD
jgi:hypothetical protein